MCIKRVSMANHLLKNDIKLERIDRDISDRSRLVFFFEDSENTNEAMKNFQRVDRGREVGFDENKQENKK